MRIPFAVWLESARPIAGPRWRRAVLGRAAVVILAFLIVTAIQFGTPKPASAAGFCWKSGCDVMSPYNDGSWRGSTTCGYSNSGNVEVINVYEFPGYVGQLALRWTNNCFANWTELVSASQGGYQDVMYIHSMSPAANDNSNGFGCSVDMVARCLSYTSLVDGSYAAQSCYNGGCTGWH
jgi:hypothetical protein